MRRLFYYFGLLFFIAACKKNELGGKAEISGVVAHHTKGIPAATVYIKFSAKEFPGNDSTVYDASVKADDHGRFSVNVYKGDYYLYATGIDMQPQATFVKGGVPVTTRNKEKVEITIAVSEKH